MGRLLVARKSMEYLSVEMNAIKSTVTLMDEFEGKHSSHIKYGALELKKALSFRYWNKRYGVTLYISRDRPENYPVYEGHHLEPSITFTDLRAKSKVLIDLSDTSAEEVPQNSIFYTVLRTIEKFSNQHGIEVGKKLPLEVPFKFRAQNSDDLKDYGDEWQWGQCVKKGTNYGETTAYYVTYIRIENI